MSPVRRVLFTVLCLCIFTFLLCSKVSWGDELKAGIFFDGSGSMKGFFHDNGASIRDINVRLHTVLTAVHVEMTESSVFISSGDDLQMISLEEHLNNPKWGSDTRLDAALSSAGELDIVLLVSDNVQDSGQYGVSSTMNFYQMFDTDSVAAVMLVPLKFPFNGPLYFYKNRHPDRGELVKALIRENPQVRITAGSKKGKVYQMVTYQGNKALILYAILKSEVPVDLLKAFTNRLEEKFGVLPLMVKPVDQGNFLLEEVLTKDEVIQSFNSFEELCSPEDGQKKIAVPRPNLVLTSPQKNVYRASVGNRGPVYELHAEKGLPAAYSTDRSNTLRFYSRIVNRSATTVLGPPGEFEPCSDKIRMELKQISFTIPRNLQTCFFRPEPVVVRIRPDYIPRLINREGGENNSQHHAGFVISNQLKIPRLRPFLKVAHPFDSMANLIKLAFCRQIPMTVKGTLNVRVPAGHFSVDPVYEEKYFTRSVFDQQRIYTPEDIVAYINRSTTILEYDLVSKDLVLLPPSWIKALVFSTLGGLILLGVLIGVSLTRTVCLRFDDPDWKTLRIALAPPFASGEYVRNGRTVLRVQKKLFGYHAYPSDGYHLVDMDDQVLAMARLKSGEAFQISGPDWANVIVEITACNNIPIECEVDELTSITKIGSQKPPEGDEGDWDEGVSEKTDSTEKGDA